MGNAPDQPARTLVRRRAIAQGAAWAVPVIAVVAAAPAYAASGTVTVYTQGSCPNQESGSILVTVEGLPVGQSVVITLTGSFGATSAGSASVTGSGAIFQLVSSNVAGTFGSIDVARPALTGQGSAVVTATVTSGGSNAVVGDTTATLTFTRAGNVYTCVGSP